MSEQFYDEEIAPALLALADKAKEHGMTFVARVEWAPGEGGSTFGGDFSSAGIAQVMTALSARSNGNVDGVLLELIKRFNVSASIFLAAHNQHPEPSNEH